jgi:hypothetical protein
LISSAYCVGVRRTTAMSLVTWSPAIGMHRGVADGAAGEHRDVGGAAADVDQAHAELLLVVGQHRVAGGQLLEHDVLDVRPQRWMHLMMFCAALSAPVTMCTLASSRTPDMPIGSRMPSW